MDLADALRTEWDGRHKFYIFPCASGCGAEVRRNVTKARRETEPKCYLCSRRTRPFQHTFTKVRLSAAQQGHEFALTYTQLLALTEVKTCHYCTAPIPWEPWSTGKRKYAKGYFLDRKNNECGYTPGNVVVCCTDCNRMRGARFTYEEMLLLSPALKKITRARNK